MPTLQLLQRRRARGASSGGGTPTPPAASTFNIAANVAGTFDYVPEPTYVDKVRAFRGFGTVSDPATNGVVRPALNATDRWPAEDFGFVVPVVPTVAGAQTLKCKLFGLATIAVSGNAGYSIANQVVSGDDTTFDLNIAAGNVSVGSQAILTFTNTKRTAASATNTGCRKLVIKADGYSIADTTLLMPNVQASWARFYMLRFMDLSAVNSNLYTINVADRATDTNLPLLPFLQDAPTISIEDACRTCNTVSKHLWWNIPARASDALITDMATVARTMLNSNLIAFFELANENWNTAFAQTTWWVDQAMSRCNGFSYQYSGNGAWNAAATFGVSSNVFTVRFRYPHNLTTGDKINCTAVLGPSGNTRGAIGIKTVTSTPDAYTVTWSEVAADLATMGGLVDPGGDLRFGRTVLSVTASGGVATVETGIDHGYSPGQTIRVNGQAFTAGANTIIATPTARTFTMSTSAADGPVTLGGSYSWVGLFTDTLNSFDNGYDQFLLGRRCYAERTIQMSNLIKAVYTGPEWNTRVKVGLFNQPGESQSDQLNYINTVFGPPSTYLYAIGKGTYYFFNGAEAGGGGVDLRNLNTFNGNTPISIADYQAQMAIAVGVRKSGYGLWDGTAMNAAIYNLKMMQYEFGPDAAGSANSTSTQQKLDSLFDIGAKAPIHRQILDDMEDAGFETVAVYNAGVCPVGSNLNTQGWPIFRTFNVSTIRTDAIDEKIAATRTGPRRNLLAATGTTVINPKQYLGVYDNSAASFPTLGGAAPYSGAVAQRNWIVTSQVDGDYTFVADFTTITQTTECRLFVNGVNTGADFPLTVGNTQMSRTITLRKGVNNISLRQGDLFLGSLTTATNFSFTKLP